MKFVYKARHKQNNNLLEGTIEAKDEKSAVSDLLLQDLIPTEVIPQESYGAKGEELENYSHDDIANHPYRQKDYLYFFRHLSDLLESGFPVLKCLDMMAKECENRKFSLLIVHLKDQIKEGDFLSNAMTRFPKAFPAYYTALIKSSELNGQLVSALKTLADDVEKKANMQKTIMQSLLYPATIFVVGVIAFVVLLVFVLPRVSALFSDFDVLLPLPTRIVMGMSDFFIHYGLFVLGGIVAFIVVVLQLFKDKSMRLSVDEKILSVPFFGRFVMLVELSRFFRVLGISIENGVDLVVAYRSSLGVVGNGFIKKDLKTVMDEVTGGEKLSAAFKRLDYFPESFYGMVSMGEQKASLGKDFIKIAKNYDEIVQDYAQKCVDLIGPVILIVVVAFVGVVLISVMMPILQMNMTV